MWKVSYEGNMLSSLAADCVESIVTFSIIQTSIHHMTIELSLTVVMSKGILKHLQVSTSIKVKFPQIEN